MKLYAEIYPFTKERNINEEIQNLEDYDGFDIPDNPLGYPKTPPLLIGYVLRKRYENKEIIINQTLNSVEEINIRSVIKGAKYINSSIVFTMGDKPKYGNEINDLTSEKALKISKDNDIKTGLILSFSKSDLMIYKRLKSNADFYFGLNIDNVKRLSTFNEYNIIPYIIIKTQKNYKTIKAIKQPYVDFENLREYCDELEKYGIKSVLLSTPGDKRGLYNILSVL